jgi:hypothetical protein
MRLTIVNLFLGLGGGVSAGILARKRRQLNPPYAGPALRRTEAI